MLPEILTFVGLATASHGVKKALDAGANRLAPEKLSSDLSAAIHAWASGLSQSGVADALIKVLFDPPYDEPGPARVELRSTIEQQQLPIVETWFRALYERWNEVRESGDDLQPFFTLETSTVVPLLQDLATRLDRVCRSDSSLFQVSIVSMMRFVSGSVANVERMLLERATPPLAPSADQISEKLRSSSAALLRYPSTVTQHGHFIPRPELQVLIEKIDSLKSSASVLLGERGAGKSSLLSRVANEAVTRGWTLLAVKADMLPASTTEESLAKSTGLSMSIDDAIRFVARDRKVVVLLDQVDAIAEVSDRNTDRLNILLDLVHRVSSVENVHVVLSSREFEFRTDSRLTSLQFESLRLDLPPFESTVAILEEAGHVPAAFGDVLRELLRNPLALKIFLDVARPQEHFTSLGSLLERHWSMHVTAGSHAAERARLLERIADRMTDEEHLSVPLAIADDLPDALRGLQAAGMLLADERSLAFRHQAFYEFTVARRFGTGRADLVAHVIERQDGLFVRPTILTTLVLLRETSPREYERTLGALMSEAVIRPHVKALVTDFLGNQREPSTVEINLLLPLLDDDTLAPRVLNAVAASPGWFAVMYSDARFLRWLKDPAHAFRCLALLTSAVEFSREAVLLLIMENWIGDASFDNLTAQVIRQFESIDRGVASVAATIVGRTGSVEWLVEHLGVIDAAVGARLIGVDLDRRVLKTCEGLKEVNNKNDIRGSFEQLVDRDERHEFLADIAEKAPVEFVTATWRRFVQIAEILARDVRHPDLAYRRVWTFEMDRGPIPSPPILYALRIALRRYAELSDEEFLIFVRESAPTEISTIHALLIEGLEAVAAKHPTEVLEYLLADRRRLAIGSEGERYGDSARLVGAIHPRLDDADRRHLESAISSFAPHAVDPSDDAEKRRAVARWNRRHRFGLLKALDPRLIDDVLRRHIGAEDRFFGEEPQRLAVRSYWVGSRMKKEEIERASDKDVFNLVNQLTDGNPRRIRDSHSDPERSGGAEQLAHEIGQAVERSPDRALRLIEQLDPGKHQSYAPSLIGSLIKGGVDVETLYRVVCRLDEQGFRSSQFRGNVGWELHERGKGHGLPEPIVSMLGRWLDEMPPDGEGESTFAQDQTRQPILSGYHMGGGWPSRGSVFAGFTVGLLDRPTPAVNRWIERVRQDIGRESSLPFWELVIGEMATCFETNRAAANALLGDIVAANPALLERMFSLTCLGNYNLVLEPALVRGWMAQMWEMPSTVAQQAWGELFMIQQDFGENDEKWIAELLGSDRVDAIIGLCYGANYVWTDEKRRSTAAAILISVIDRFGVNCGNAVSHFLREVEGAEFIDADAERVIRAILTKPAMVEKLVSELLAALGPCATKNPALTYEVTKKVLDIGEASIGSPSGLLFSQSGDLTTLALTLHRQSAHRAAGLELFERLIALNVYEAEAALELLDRRAARRYAPRPRRRVPRRRRKHRPRRQPEGN
jgi:hypothetical protein